jgi:hypothetical protein
MQEGAAYSVGTGRIGASASLGLIEGNWIDTLNGLHLMKELLWTSGLKEEAAGEQITVRIGPWKNVTGRHVRKEWTVIFR